MILEGILLIKKKLPIVLILHYPFPALYAIDFFNFIIFLTLKNPNNIFSIKFIYFPSFSDQSNNFLILFNIVKVLFKKRFTATGFYK